RACRDSPTASTSRPAAPKTPRGPSGMPPPEAHSPRRRAPTRSLATERSSPPHPATDSRARGSTSVRGSAGTGSGTSDGTTALVLAGGLGTRLRPCVADRPKVLAAVGGAPLLARLLDQLAAAEVKRPDSGTGWLGDQVERVFGASFAGMPLVHARERQPLGTAGALRAALPLVTGDDVLVLNGDSFCAAALPAFVSWARARRAPAALVAAAVEDASRFGTLHLEGRTVRGFVEKAPGRARAWISAGIYRFT